MVQSGQGKKIGLLGGSFNPAHAGHVYISGQALKMLGLDETWWLVSKQNPLKETQGMVEFEERVQFAREIAAENPNIIVSDFETSIKTNYTYDTLKAIKAGYPEHQFVWLMGADNLIQLPKWYRWQDIMNLVPIAVFNRDSLKDKALESEAAIKFASSKINDTKQLVTSLPPAWAFLDIKTHPASATKIRETDC